MFQVPLNESYSRYGIWQGCGVLQNIIVCKIVKNITAFVGIWIFITMLKRDCSFCLYCARLILSTPSNSIALQFIIILSFHLDLDLQSDLFPSDILTKPSYAFVCFFMHTICPLYLILLELNTRKVFSVEYKSWSPSLCNCLLFPITCSLLCPNIFFSTLFFITLMQLTVYKDWRQLRHRIRHRHRHKDTDTGTDTKWYHLPLPVPTVRRVMILGWKLSQTRINDDILFNAFCC